MRKFLTLAAAASLLLANTATAGALLSAELNASLAGATAIRAASGATGNLDTGTGAFSLDAGSAFAGNQTIATSVTAAGGAATIMFVSLNWGTNGAIAGNTASNAPGTFGVTGGGIKATGIATGTALGAMGITLAQIALSAGGNMTGNQPVFTLTVGMFLTLATLTLGAPEGDLWNLGTVSATGLFTGPAATPTPLPDVTAMGNVSVTGGGNTVVTLVTLAKTQTQTNSVQGQANSISASPVFLTLTYAPGGSTPEPGTILLLGAGLLGLATVGRRKA